MRSEEKELKYLVRCFVETVKKHPGRFKWTIVEKNKKFDLSYYKVHDKPLDNTYDISIAENPFAREAIDRWFIYSNYLEHLYPTVDRLGNIIYEEIDELNTFYNQRGEKLRSIKKERALRGTKMEREALLKSYCGDK